MYQSFTKKLAIAAGLMVLAYPPQLIEGQEVTGGEDTSTYGFVEQNRNAWRVFGCSQHGDHNNTNNNDGALPNIFDDTFTSYWHTNYGFGKDEAQTGHFFVIDRGADFANATIDGFGYMPRVEGQGHVKKFRIYVISEEYKSQIEALPHVGLGQSQQTAANSHNAMTAFLNGFTAVETDHNNNEAGAPTNQGVFDYDPSQTTTSNRQLQQVKFTTPQTGRYVVFAIDYTTFLNGDRSQHATCAEFYLYDWLDTEKTKTVNIELKRFKEPHETLYTGTREVVVGQTVPAYGFATCDHQGRVDENTDKLTYTINETEEVYIISAANDSGTFGDKQRTYIGTSTINGTSTLSSSTTKKKMLMIKSRINDGAVYLCDPEGDLKGRFGGYIPAGNNGIPLADAPRNAQPYLLVQNEDFTFALRNANRRTNVNDFISNGYGTQPKLGGKTNTQNLNEATSHWFIVPVENEALFEANLEYFSPTVWRGGRLSTAISLGEQELNQTDALTEAVANAKTADFGRSNIETMTTAIERLIDPRPTALSVFKTYTGVEYAAYEAYGGPFSVPGWASVEDTKAVNLYNALKANDNTAIASALSAINPGAESQENQKNTDQGGARISEGVLFQIRSLTDGCGYLCVTDDGVLTTSENTLVENKPVYGSTEDAANFLFGYVIIDGENYMYSAKTGALLNAFAPKNDIASHANVHQYTWQMTTENGTVVPTPMKLISFSWGNKHSMTFLGGLRTSSTVDNRGGLSVHPGCVRPVVACGITNSSDGNAFKFTYGGLVKNYSNINLDNIKAQISEAIAAANAAAKDLPGEDVDAKIVNGLTDEAITAVKGAATPDHKEYLMASGARNEVTAGTVYTLQNATTGKYFAIVNGAQGEADAITDTHTNWFCEAGEAEGTFKFAHTVNTAEAQRAVNKVYLTINGATEHTIAAGDYGQVKIGDTPYVMATGSGDAVTTGIREITADANGSTVVYDLQGRRVAKTAKGGLYIVNGVKTLVK